MCCSSIDVFIFPGYVFPLFFFFPLLLDHQLFRSLPLVMSPYRVLRNIDRHTMFSLHVAPQYCCTLFLCFRRDTLVYVCFHSLRTKLCLSALGRSSGLANRISELAERCTSLNLIKSHSINSPTQPSRRLSTRN